MKSSRALATLTLCACVALAGCGKEGSGQRVEGLVGQLRSGTKEEKIAAANALAELGEQAAPAVPQLIETMKQGQSMFDPVEMAASKALTRIGRPAALALVQEVKSGPSRMSISATLGDLAPLVVPELEELSRSTDERLREKAVEVLGEGGKDAALVLGEALSDVEESVKRAAASSLMKMGPDAAGALPHLVAAVERRDADIIGQVVAALGTIGPAAKDALPALRSLSRGENMPKGKELSAGLLGEIEKSIKKIEGQIRNP